MPQNREDARPVVSHGASLFPAGAIFRRKIGADHQANGTQISVTRSSWAVSIGVFR